jgi:hypothetical protein
VLANISSTLTTHNLVYKLGSTGLLIDEKQKHKSQVLTEEKLDDIGARLDHTPSKSLKRLAQETGLSKSSAKSTAQLLKLRPCKTTVIHTLHLRNAARRVHFCSWFLQSVIEGENDPQLTETAFSAPPVICEL